MANFFEILKVVLQLDCIKKKKNKRPSSRAVMSLFTRNKLSQFLKKIKNMCNSPPKKDYMLLIQLCEPLTVVLQQLKYSRRGLLFLINHQTQPLTLIGGCSNANKTVDLSFCSSFTLCYLGKWKNRKTNKKKLEIKN